LSGVTYQEYQSSVARDAGKKAGSYKIEITILIPFYMN